MSLLRADPATVAMHRARRLLGLPWSERWLLLGLLFLLPLSAAMLRVSGYVRLRRRLERLSRAASVRASSEEDLARARRLADLVALAGRRGFVRVSCLPQALLVHALLRRRGLEPDLRIGVRKPGDEVEAHAWVELRGQELGSGSMGHLAFDESRVRPR